MVKVFSKLIKINPSHVKDRTPLGIPNSVSNYLMLTPQQSILTELKGLDEFINHAIKSNQIFTDKIINVEFINYGRTQLVFVATNDKGVQQTLIVNQPATKLGVGKQEFENLNRLNQLDSNLVIKPISYYQKDGHELYSTPYYLQARCIGIETHDWGRWIPEPMYRFKQFDEIEKTMVNELMVASLIKLYDQENHQGVAKCRLDGGDFMLLKDIEGCEITYENIFKNLKLIAAREMIEMNLDAYIDQLRIELTDNKLKSSELKILGRKLKRPLEVQEFNMGIAIGMELRNQKKNLNQDRIEKELI